MKIYALLAAIAAQAMAEDCRMASPFGPVVPPTQVQAGGATYMWVACESGQQAHDRFVRFHCQLEKAAWPPTSLNLGRSSSMEIEMRGEGGLTSP